MRTADTSALLRDDNKDKLRVSFGGALAGWVFVVTVFSSVFCAAVNVYTWVLGYPLWEFAGREFGVVHREYLRRLTPVITVPHVVMFFASVAGCWWRAMPRWACWLVFGLNTAVIVVSVGAAGPVHDRFVREGFDVAGLRRLVWVSGLRSVLMVASCGVLGWWMLRVV